MSPELIGILGLAGISVTLGLFMMKRIDRVGDRVTRLEVAFTDRTARREDLLRRLHAPVTASCYRLLRRANLPVP